MRSRLVVLCSLLAATVFVACSDDATDDLPVDSGRVDVDSGLDRDADVGTSDGGPIDTGAPDIGLSDGGVEEDASVADAGTVEDSGSPVDSGLAMDASEMDAGTLDAGDADAGMRTTIFPGFCPSTDTAPGLYQGTLASNLNDIASASCIGPTPGRDGALRVTVPNGATLSVTYQSTGDGILYILDSCPVVGSCLVGADSTISGPESVSWTNTGGVDNPVYIVLDTADINEPSAFTLDLFLQ